MPNTTGVSSLEIAFSKKVPTKRKLRLLVDHPILAESLDLSLGIA